MDYQISSEAEMLKLGGSMAEELRSGDVLALVGQLGAGKTHFSKGVVAGLGDASEVTSPTFTLVHEYLGGRLPVFHFDFYRLDSADEVLRIGWDEYVDEPGVLLVEWADKFAELIPSEAIWWDFSINENGSRSVTRKEAAS